MQRFALLLAACGAPTAPTPAKFTPPAAAAPVALRVPLEPAANSPSWHMGLTSNENPLEKPVLVASGTRSAVLGAGTQLFVVTADRGVTREFTPPAGTIWIGLSGDRILAADDTGRLFAEDGKEIAQAAGA